MRTLEAVRRAGIRTAALAVPLALLGSLAPVFPLAARQFRLDLLPEPTDYLVVLFAVTAWAVAVHLVRRVARLPGAESPRFMAPYCPRAAG